MASIKVYGADWCSMTKSALRHLDQLGVEYQYINIDHDREAAQWVAAQNGGKEKKPTIDIDGEILSEPPSGLLDQVLQTKGLLNRQK
jgi:glutaredoxin